MTHIDNGHGAETISIDDYVACTIEGRVVKVVETLEGKKYTVKYFDNMGEVRLRQLYLSELELADEDDAPDVTDAVALFPITGFMHR